METIDLDGMIEEFHRHIGAPVDSVAITETDRWNFRNGLLDEEVEELRVATALWDRAEFIDAVGDIIYVVTGHLVEMGVNVNEVLRRIHASNMTKEASGLGKAIKGENFQPVDLSDL